MLTLKLVLGWPKRLHSLLELLLSSLSCQKA